MNAIAPPASPRGHWLKALQVVVTAALVGALIWFVDWRAALQVLRQVSPFWSVVVVLIVLLERMMSNLKWWALLDAGGIGIGFWRLLRIQLAANALGTFLPSSLGVDALRIAGLWRYRDHRHQAIAATLLDRITTVLTTVCVGGLMLVLVAGALVGERARLQVIVGGIVLLALIIFILSRPGRRLMLHAVSWLPERLRHRVTEVGSAAMITVGHPRSVAITVVSSLAIVAVRIVLGKCLLLACGVDVSLVTLGFVLPLVWAVAMLPISIGGFGVQDATYVLLLGYAGVTADVAIVVSLLDHVLSRVPILVGILFWRDVMPSDAARGTE